ncbi:hypothetical protein [Streptomyces werraensis]|uniref:hypothetical protein n=1 Tax=Streptomyces werraensis TaxID=68284 RepID=UPI0037CE7FA7
MSAAAEHPLLFLDVDGPLIPFGPAQPSLTESVPDHGNPLLSRLDPTVGPRLLALSCSLVWATTWMEEANAVVAPRLGLPKLPVLEWPEADEPSLHGLHWKTRPLVGWARGRPFVWVDDEIGTVDRLWVAAAHPGPVLLHRVDPARGLQDSDFLALSDWLAALDRPS